MFQEFNFYPVWTFQVQEKLDISTELQPLQKHRFSRLYWGRGCRFWIKSLWNNYAAKRTAEFRCPHNSEFRLSVYDTSNKFTVAIYNSPTVFSDKPTSSTSDIPRASSNKPFRHTSLSPLPSNSEQILNGDEQYRTVLNHPWSRIKLIRQGTETKKKTHIGV